MKTDVTHHNMSHTVIKTVISNECHEFKSVMEECKAGCLNPVMDKMSKKTNLSLACTAFSII